ncbi:hypothetical protein D3C80_1346970 [compost metagenome]
MPLFVRQHNVLVANDARLCVVHYALLIHSAWAICAMRCWGPCSETVRIPAFGPSYKSNGYEWGIGFVPPDVPLFTATTSGLQWTHRGRGWRRTCNPHPFAQLMLWARPSRYASQQSAHPSHQEGCRGRASSRIRRRDRICCLRTVRCFRR